MKKDEEGRTKTLWTGGPLDGEFLWLPDVLRSFTFNAEANRAKGLEFVQRHRYELHHSDLKQQMPVYCYAGVES